MDLEDYDGDESMQAVDDAATEDTGTIAPQPKRVAVNTHRQNPTSWITEKLVRNLVDGDKKVLIGTHCRTEKNIYANRSGGLCTMSDEQISHRWVDVDEEIVNFTRMYHPYGDLGLKNDHMKGSHFIWYFLWCFHGCKRLIPHGIPKLSPDETRWATPNQQGILSVSGLPILRVHGRCLEDENLILLYRLADWSL